MDRSSQPIPPIDTLGAHNRCDPACLVDTAHHLGRGGLAISDLIVGLDGHMLTDSDELLEQLPHYHHGDQITLRIERDGVETELNLTLHSRYE